jgi:hypothetical protein
MHQYSWWRQQELWRFSCVLFRSGFFNDAVSTSDRTVSNVTKVSAKMKCRGCGRKRLWRDPACYAISLEGLRKPMKIPVRAAGQRLQICTKGLRDSKARVSPAELCMSGCHTIMTLLYSELSSSSSSSVES